VGYPINYNLVNPHNLCASDNSSPPHHAYALATVGRELQMVQKPSGGTEIFETTPPSKKPSAFSAGKRGKNTRAKSHFDPVRKWCRKHAVTFIVTLPVGLSRGLASRPFFKLSV
jgi:hypothetical protein